MHFEIQIQYETNWVTLILYESEEVDQAKFYCDRALMSFKVNARVVEMPEEEIVYEKFYNQRLDPDARDYDDNWESEDDLEADWAREGF